MHIFTPICTCWCLRFYKNPLQVFLVITFIQGRFNVKIDLFKIPQNSVIDVDFESFFI